MVLLLVVARWNSFRTQIFPLTKECGLRWSQQDLRCSPNLMMKVEKECLREKDCMLILWSQLLWSKVLNELLLIFNKNNFLIDILPSVTAIWNKLVVYWTQKVMELLCQQVSRQGNFKSHLHFSWMKPQKQLKLFCTTAGIFLLLKVDYTTIHFEFIFITTERSYCSHDG